MKKKLLALLIPTVLTGVLTGCASTAVVEDGVKKADRMASEALESLRSVKEESGPVIHKEESWVPISQISDVDYRSARLLNRHVVVNRYIDSIADAASYITSLTGIPVFVSLPPGAGSTTAIGTNGTGGGTGIAAQPGFSSPSPISPQPGFPSTLPLPGSKAITYSGKLSGLLDIISARFNVFWEPEGDGLRFFKTKSRSFRLSALPGDSSMTSTIGTQTSGSSSGSGGASATTEQKSGISFNSLSVWKAIEDSIKTMLSPDGRVVVTPATGTVTVDDTPHSLERVAKFIHDQNMALSRQVILNVRVLSVDITDSDSYGINWDAIYKNLGSGTIALGSPSGLLVGSSTLTFNIIDTTSRWDGTQAILEALSKQGKVSQITSASIVTVNNQPAPIQVGRQLSYLASSTTTIGTGGAGNTTTLEPGVVTTGFSMSVLPHILDDGRLMLQYTGDISSLVNISTVTSGGSSIQTPEIDTRNFLQRVIMKSGETLVLTGFEQNTLNSAKQGIGSASNIALGGSIKNSNNRSLLVVLIQPIVSAGTD